MGAYSGVGTYLSKSLLRVEAYSGGGLFGTGGSIDHLRYMNKIIFEIKLTLSDINGVLFSFPSIIFIIIFLRY